MYVFAAEDFAQAVIRFQLLQSYSSLRKEQVEQIQGSQLELAENRLSLEVKREELEKVLADVRSERNRLANDRSQRRALVESLKGEESRLRAQVQQAEAEKKRLNKAIRKIIEAELKAERESSAGEFALTPEGKIVSAAFERNRSALLAASSRRADGKIWAPATEPARNHHRQQRHRHFHRSGELGPFGLRRHGLQHV